MDGYAKNYTQTETDHDDNDDEFRNMTPRDKVQRASWLNSSSYNAYDFKPMNSDRNNINAAAYGSRLQDSLLPAVNNRNTQQSNLSASLLNLSKSIVTAKEAVSKNFSARYYPLIAFLSGLCFCLHNLFFVKAIEIGAERGQFLTLLFPYFIGEGIFGLIVMIYRGI